MICSFIRGRKKIEDNCRTTYPNVWHYRWLLSKVASCTIHLLQVLVVHVDNLELHFSYWNYAPRRSSVCDVSYWFCSACLRMFNLVSIQSRMYESCLMPISGPAWHKNLHIYKYSYFTFSDDKLDDACMQPATIQGNARARQHSTKNGECRNLYSL